MVSPSALRAQHLAEHAERHFDESPNKLWVPPGRSPAISANDGLDPQDLADAFPDLPLPFTPLGNLVLVQIRQEAKVTSGGIKLPDSEQQTERDNTQIGRVVAVGPLAFRNRETGIQWPEGAWCDVGDFVRFPKYQGDYTALRYQRVVKVTDLRTGDLKEEAQTDWCRFAGIKDIALLGRYESAEKALAAKAFYT